MKLLLLPACRYRSRCLWTPLASQLMQTSLKPQSSWTCSSLHMWCWCMAKQVILDTSAGMASFNSLSVHCHGNVMTWNPVESCSDGLVHVASGRACGLWMVRY